MEASSLPQPLEQLHNDLPTVILPQLDGEPAATPTTEATELLISSCPPGYSTNHQRQQLPSNYITLYSHPFAPHPGTHIPASSMIGLDILPFSQMNQGYSIPAQFLGPTTTQPDRMLPVVQNCRANLQLNANLTQQTLKTAASTKARIVNAYPQVYVSVTGLITVLLHHDVAVEVTIERNFRIVNHRHKAVLSCHNRGNINYIYHVAAKIYQEGMKTDVELFGDRRARLQTDGIVFSSGMETYMLNNAGNLLVSQMQFSDMVKDSSVNVLFYPLTEMAALNALTPDTLLQCEEIAKNARCINDQNMASTTVIHGVMIHQDEFGDVTVTHGTRTASTSPIYGSVSLQTKAIDITVQVNWNVSLSRGSSKLRANYTNFVVSNGKHEAGFDEYRDIFTRVNNMAVTEFESWLPTLTYLCNGLPGVGKLYGAGNRKSTEEIIPVQIDCQSPEACGDQQKQ